ncbi:MAG: ChrR family anti-sigma-E factor [Pseudomonadota bacterium]
MTTTTHPDFDMLSAYAAGTLSDGMSLLVASHLTYCPECRARVAEIEALGAAAFASAPEPQPINGASDAMLDAIFAEIDTGPGPAKPAVEPGSPLPAPIRSEIGVRFDDLPWKFRLPGLHECMLEGFDGEEVSLLRARPGVRMLSHTHQGEEATLILSGAMRDGERTYRRGDVAIADSDDDHRPEIVGDEVCVCLIVMSGGMQFTGRFTRALNILNR